MKLTFKFVVFSCFLQSIKVNKTGIFVYSIVDNTTYDASRDVNPLLATKQDRHVYELSN